MLIISHRGAKGLAPENTKASFEIGFASSANYVEFDIRTSSDGVLVINHNRLLKGHPVILTAYKKLKQLHPKLMTFAEVLQLNSHDKPLLIDIKPGADTARVIDALHAANLPEGSILGSFSFKILTTIKKEFPDAQVAVFHKWSGVIATSRAHRLGTKLVAINHKWLWSGFVKSLMRNEYQLVAYTVNSKRRAEKLRKYQLHAIVSDHPDLLS